MNPIAQSDDGERSRLEEVAKEIVAGTRELHDLPPWMTAKQAGSVRRRALETMHGISLDTVGRYTFDGERAASRRPASSRRADVPRSSFPDAIGWRLPGATRPPCQADRSEELKRERASASARRCI